MPTDAFTIIIWASLTGALLLALRSWLTFADQPLIPLRRSFVVGTYPYRNALRLGTLGLLGLGLVAWRLSPVSVPALAVITMAVLSGLFWAWAFYAPTLMFRSQEHTSRFVDVTEAGRRLRPTDEVIVLEVNGDARAYTDSDLLQPHVAGTARVGGEQVSMTYCGLSHLGTAYTPAIGAQPLDLHAINQVENNLLLIDRRSGTVVQQIFGYREGDSTRSTMREWPTRRMPFKSFAALHPKGLVFVNDLSWRNPVARIWDGAIRLMMSTAIRFQDRRLVFPTPAADPRLPTAARVSAFHVAGDYVAYTEDWVREHGGLINVVVGGRAVVVAWDASYSVLSAFYNDTGAPVSVVDARGQTPTASLALVETWKAGIYWGVLTNFVGKVDLNRSATKP